jgi:hypothetical protein
MLPANLPTPEAVIEYAKSIGFAFVRGRFGTPTCGCALTILLRMFEPEHLWDSGQQGESCTYDRIAKYISGFRAVYAGFDHTGRQPSDDVELYAYGTRIRELAEQHGLMAA